MSKIELIVLGWILLSFPATLLFAKMISWCDGRHRVQIFPEGIIVIARGDEFIDNSKTVLVSTGTRSSKGEQVWIKTFSLAMLRYRFSQLIYWAFVK